MKPTRLTVFCTVAALFAAAPAFAGLIAHYEIQEDGTPLAIEDVSGNGRNAAFIDTQDPPAPLYVEGYPCTAGGTLQFNGTTQYVDASGHFGTGIYLNPAFTVALWVKGAPQADMRVFAEGSTANTTPLVTIGTRTATDGTAKFYIRGSATIERYSTRVAFDNTWHHVAWVDRYGQATLYIDGVADATVFNYTRTALTTDTTTIGGILRAAASHWFSGAIDDVRLYNYALTPQQIDDIIHGTVTPEGLFKRGDANADGKLDIADAIKVLGYLFGGGTSPTPSRSWDTSSRTRVRSRRRSRGAVSTRPRTR